VKNYFFYLKYALVAILCLTLRLDVLVLRSAY